MLPLFWVRIKETKVILVKVQSLSTLDFFPEFSLHFCIILKHSGPVRYHTRTSVSGSFGYTMIRLTATRGNIQPLFGSLLSSYTQHSYFSTRSFNHGWPPFFKSKNSLSMRDCLLNISLVSFLRIQFLVLASVTTKQILPWQAFPSWKAAE